MYGYSMSQWLLFFYFYCFFGWCFESAYVSIKERKWVNRGFLRGPFLPLYGSGAIMMLVVSFPFQDSLFLIYIAGFIGATALEYVTGVTMEALFKVRYWDYSVQPLNFKGQICFGSSVGWGFMTIFMTKFLHKPVEQSILSMKEPTVSYIVFALTIVIVIDFALSFKAALDLRDILVKMESVKEELEHLQKRLDVIVAVAGDAKSEYLTGISNKFEQVKENVAAIKQESKYRSEELQLGIEIRLEGLKNILSGIHSDKLEEFREEIVELRTKYTLELENRLQLKSLKDFYRRHLIMDNPTMKSSQFKESLEELKESVSKKKSDSDKK